MSATRHARGRAPHGNPSPFGGQHNRNPKSTALLGIRAGVLLQRGPQVQVADQAMQIVGMQPQQPRSFGVIAAGLLHGAEDELFLRLAHGIVKRFGGRAGRTALVQDGLRQVSGRIRSEVPSTTARSMAFSSSRHFRAIDSRAGRRGRAKCRPPSGRTACRTSKQNSWPAAKYLRRRSRRAGMRSDTTFRR